MVLLVSCVFAWSVVLFIDALPFQVTFFPTGYAQLCFSMAMLFPAHAATSDALSGSFPANIASSAFMDFVVMFFPTRHASTDCFRLFV